MRAFSKKHVLFLGKRARGGARGVARGGARGVARGVARGIAGPTPRVSENKHLGNSIDISFNPTVKQLVGHRAREILHSVLMWT